MITAIAAAAALALALAGAPADTDTEPIDKTFLVIFLSSDAAEPLCDAYGAFRDILGGLNLDYEAEEIFVDVGDAYAIVSLEGDTLRLSPEARDFFVDWLHLNCT